MQLTDEQTVIVKTARDMAHAGGVLKIAAAAGTGKTTTLFEVAKAITEAHKGRVLYLAYNRAIVDEARSKFAGVAEVSTLHSLAYREMAIGALQRPLQNVDIKTIIELLGLKSDYGLSSYKAARFISNTLTNFCASAADSLSPDLIVPHVRRRLDAAAQDWIATRSWDLFLALSPLRRPIIKSLPVPHDLYVKVWHLSGTPGLRDYTTVLLDEAQDANPVIAHAIENARHVVYVGDEHQQIYSFRGAINAMQRMPGIELPLTQSFRWGPDVAEVANRVLAHKSVPPKWAIRGTAALHTNLAQVDNSKKHARLYRANRDLIGDALFLEDMHHPTALVGDRKNFISLIASAKALHDGQMRGIKHRALANYDSWEELLEAVESDNDEDVSQDARQAVSVVRDYGARVDDLVGLLERTQDEASALVTLTTAHQAKGREWDQVIVCHDFDHILERASTQEKRDMEYNLLYVAVTRAKRCMELQSDFLRDLMADRL